MTAAAQARTPPASLRLLHLNFLFAGMGTLLLGPTLPLYAHRWGLHDSQSGILIASQFAGLFCGAVALFSSLRRSLLCGAWVATISFLSLALSLFNPHGFPLAAVSLFALGLGLGQITTTTNLLSTIGARGASKRSSALSLLNFTWSAGAVLSPLVAGLYLAHANMTALLLTFAGCAIGLGLLIAMSLPASPQRSQGATMASVNAPGCRIGIAPLLYFFLLYLLYGGLESTVSGWLSTYTLRYTQIGVAAAAYCTSSLWISFALGRALCAWLVHHLPEHIIRLGGIVLATAATACLSGAHSSLSIAACASVVGLGLGPFFPLTFSVLIARHPTSRQAGAATSNIGLGSAIFPYAIGWLSTHFGSLKIAMLTPIFISLTILLFIATEPKDSPVTAEAAP